MGRDSAPRPEGLPEPPAPHRGKPRRALRRTLQAAGFADQQWAVVLDTNPPAVLTHEPLRLCPAGTVNLYGHLHGEQNRSDRHANMTVERTGYRPVRLDQVLKRLSPCGARSASTAGTWTRRWG